MELEEIEEIVLALSRTLTREVVFLAPSRLQNVKTPDIEADGLRWEIKCPIGGSSNTIKRAFKTAFNQSKNVIFDLRYMKGADSTNIARTKKEFFDLRGMERLIIIAKSKKILDFYKKTTYNKN